MAKHMKHVAGYEARIKRTISVWIPTDDENVAEKVASSLAHGISDRACSITNNAICDGDDELDELVPREQKFWCHVALDDYDIRKILEETEYEEE